MIKPKNSNQTFMRITISIWINIVDDGDENYSSFSVNPIKYI